MQITNFHSKTMENNSEEFSLDTTIPNEILEIVFDQIVNQQNQPLRDISSILLTCKKWEGVLKTNPCISLLQTLFQIKHSDRFTTIKPPRECIETEQKKNFTSKELKLMDRALRRGRAFEELLMMDSELFQSKSLFFPLLHRYIWEPQLCNNSANQRIQIIAENQLSILNSLISGTDEERLTLIKNDFIEKFYLGIEFNLKWYEAQIAVLSTLKKFRHLNDKKIFIQFAHCFGFSVFDIDESFKKDREIVLATVQQNGWALIQADESFKKDREIVLTAVKKSGTTLQFADESFKKDREIVLAAVQQNGKALQYADDSLKKDREIVLAAVQEAGSVLEFAATSLRKDREIVLAAVQQDGEVLEYADESLKKDRDIVLAAIKQNGWYLQYADGSLKKDRDIILTAIKHDGRILQLADETLKKDRKIVLAAVQQNGYALEYADESLKKDREIVLAVVRCFDSISEIIQEKALRCALRYADESLRNDPEILLAIQENG